MSGRTDVSSVNKILHCRQQYLFSVAYRRRGCRALTKMTNRLRSSGGCVEDPKTMTKIARCLHRMTRYSDKGLSTATIPGMTQEHLTTHRKVLCILLFAKCHTDLGHCSDAYNAFDCQVGNVCLVLEICSDPREQLEME